MGPRMFREELPADALPCRVRLPEPEVLIVLVGEVCIPIFTSGLFPMNIEAPGEVLVKPAPVPKTILELGMEVTAREVPVKVELLVRVPLKITPSAVIVRGLAELLVIAAP